MTRVLVTGANGDIAEAVGRVLREALPSAFIAGADAYGRWPGEFFFDRMLPLPNAESPEFLSALQEASEGFDMVIPTIEPELHRLSLDSHQRRRMPLLMVADELIGVFLDKLAASRFFEANGLPTPRTTTLRDLDSHEYPYCVKPIRGAGGRGFQIISSPAQAMELGERDHDGWLAQEYLGDHGNEYTCALFAWGTDIRQVILKRELYGGRTFRAEVCQSPEISRLLADVVRVTDLQGCINVQLKLTADGPMILEVNPRLSSTVMMRHRIGFRDCEWWVKSFLGIAIEPEVASAVGSVVYRTSVERVVPSQPA